MAEHGTRHTTAHSPIDPSRARAHLDSVEKCAVVCRVRRGAPAEQPKPQIAQWGPFRPGLDPIERKCQLRSLRLAVRLICGPRGAEAGHMLLVAETDPHPQTLAEALAEFDRLASLDRRRVLAAFGGVLP